MPSYDLDYDQSRQVRTTDSVVFCKMGIRAHSSLYEITNFSVVPIQYRSSSEAKYLDTTRRSVQDSEHRIMKRRLFIKYIFAYSHNSRHNSGGESRYV